MSSLRTPVVSVVIGEGGSGGALAIGVCDRLLMMEYAVYSVISPEGCASILWKSAEKAADAAEAMKMTTSDLASQGLVDEVVEEPMGGAHRDYDEAAARIAAAIGSALDSLCAMGYRQPDGRSLPAPDAAWPIRGKVQLGDGVGSVFGPQVLADRALRCHRTAEEYPVCRRFQRREPTPWRCCWPMHELCAPDSQASVIALHFNHRIHPDSDRWQALGEELCRSLDIEIRCGAWEGVPNDCSSEAEARAMRFAWFGEALEADRVLLLAHHRDDQVETILLNLLEGRHMARVAGMRVVRALEFGDPSPGGAAAARLFPGLVAGLRLRQRQGLDRRSCQSGRAPCQGFPDVMKFCPPCADAGPTSNRESSTSPPHWMNRLQAAQASYSEKLDNLLTTRKPVDCSVSIRRSHCLV